jgi:hypothetical protein
MSDGEGGKKSGYRLEYASSARAKCKGPKPCAGTAIAKGELRVGSLVDFKGNTSFAWRHWGCTTNKIIENMKKNFEDASELDGYDDLRPEDQEKVNKAWEEGQVADEDIPESARKAPKNNSGGETDEDEEKEKAKKKKKAAAAKKRKSEKDADLEDDEDEKPKKKRASPKKKAPAEKKEKAPAKKRAPKKKKAADTDEESGEDFTAAINDVEDDEEDAEETPDEDAGTKKRKRPASKSKGAKSPAKKAKGSGSRAKKSKAVVEDEDDED